MSWAKLAMVIALLTLLACQRKTETASVVGSLKLRDIVVDGCPVPNTGPKRVTLIELASNPARYEGMFVSVSGYYYSYFERAALFGTPEEEPYAHRASEGIWLLRMDRALAGKRVQISGIFTTGIKGHLGQWPGSLCVVNKSEFEELGSEELGSIKNWGQNTFLGFVH